MEYVVPVLLFAIGFLAALSAAKGWTMKRSGKGLDKLRVEKGAVRLDTLVRKDK